MKIFNTFMTGFLIGIIVGIIIIPLFKFLWNKFVPTAIKTPVENFLTSLKAFLLKLLGKK